MKFASKTAVVFAAVAVALPMAAISTNANAGTAPPPCTKKAIKKAIQKGSGETVQSVDSKVCKNYWAGGGYTVMNEGAAYLLQDNGGKWKLVGPNKEAKLCKPSNKTLPNKVKNAACVS